MRNSTDSASAKTRARARQVRSRVLGALTWALLAVIAVVGWPATFGGPTGYVVVSGNSMLPTYSSGDLVVTRSASSVQVGDVIVYTVPRDEPGAGMSVIHRVVAEDPGGGWVTQGDNNATVDPWKPHLSDVTGQVVAHVPFVGRVLMLLRSPVAFALVGAVVVGWLLWPGRDDEQGPGPGPASGARGGAPAADGAGGGALDDRQDPGLG